jgi:tetratricopeptide (TPR) repeat protein
VLALGLDLDATSIAEALWLAAARAADDPVPRSAAPPGAREQPAAGGEDERSHERTRPPLPGTAPPDRRQATPAEDPPTDIEPLVTGRRTLVGRARAGPQPLDLSRALRPFKRRWPDGRKLQLDIEETVRSYARTWKLVPKFRPAPERWFEVDIVIDDSPSMTVWGDMVSVLSTLLRQLGAFRTIRTWRISVTGPVPRLHNEGGQPAGTGQLRSPGGRRLIILVSDGSAAGWFRPEAWALVRDWAGSTPTALISPLATRLWARTGLGLPTARVGPGGPGSGNTQLQFAVPRHELAADDEPGAGGGWLPLPVATLTPHMLGRWARTLMKSDPRGCDALLIPPVRHPPEADAGDAADPIAAGAHLVNAFRRAASPEAARLAVLCAPFSAVSLELLELLTAELVPEASTADLAEVIVGGLFRPATGQDGELLRFRPGVRERLRELLPETDAWRAYLALIKHVTEHSGVDAGVFAAAVPDPLGDIAIPADLLPFAAASREALEFLDALPTPWRDEPMITVTRPPSGPGVPAVWGDVPFRMINFTGRDEILEQLRRAMTDGPGPPPLDVPVPSALQGLGGAGKTAIAAEYAWRYRDGYDIVWWVPAETRELAIRSLAALAVRLGVAAAGSGTEDAALAAVDALRRNEPFGRGLLIFDRADQPEEVNDLIPWGSGHVLITSRNHRWAAVVNLIEAPVFTRRESVELLRKRIPARAFTEDEADILAMELGDLPLAVDQAGALIAETGMPVAEYLRRLSEATIRILADSPASEYPVSMIAAWQITTATIGERMPEAAELLRHLAVLDGDQISLDMLSAGAGELGLGPDQVSRALDVLGRYGLTAYTGRDTISVPRLVQALALRELPAQELDTYRHRVHLMLAAVAPDDPTDGGGWARYAELYSHARMPGLSVAACTHRGVQEFAFRLLRYLRLSGELAACQSMARELIDQWVRDSGERDEHVLGAQFQLAAALRQGGDYQEARRITDQAYRTARALLGEQDELTTGLRRTLAQDLRFNGDFADALALDRESGGLLRATRGAADAQAVLAASDVGLGLLLTSQYREARDVLDRALGDQQRGLRAGAVAAAWTRLSWARLLGGDYASARSAGNGARDYARARLGARHPATIRADAVATIALRRLGSLDEARELAADVLAESSIALGPRQPDTLAAQVSLANCERELGLLTAALQRAEEAKIGHEDVLGVDHPFTHACVGAVGLLHRLMGDPAVAREVDERALSGLYRRLTPDHHYSLSVAINLASDLAALGEHHQARAMGEDALRRSRALLGEDHPVTLGCAVNLATDLRSDDDPDYADRLRSDAMRRYVRALGGDHPDTKAALTGERISFDFDPPPLS